MAIFNTGKWESWINYYIENPFKTWWKARKYFKRPKLSFHILRVTKFKNYPYASYKWIGKLLDIRIEDVQWKDKFNSPRHEGNPRIWICLFRTIAFAVNFNVYYEDEFGEKQSGDLEYWEYVLNWLYYKNQKTLRCYSAWTRNSQLYRTRHWNKTEDKDTVTPAPSIVPCVAMSLNKQGIKQLKSEL